MHSFNKSGRIIITCSKGNAPSLQKEVEELGYKLKDFFQTGIQLSGTLNDCIRLNLNLRCANHILFSLKSFECRDAAQLYNVVSKDIQWENIIDESGYFSVTSNVQNETITNSLYANVKVKDAIADRFMSIKNRRPDSGSKTDKIVINLFWKNNQAEIFLDTSGETLSKHGYRKIPGRAPMMESLAAATILATNWNRTAPFINPMCGSGTLAIEAALIATNRKPGLYRDNYAFMHILGFEDTFYVKEKIFLTEQILDIAGLIIIANDISEDAINIAKINAGAAGVAELITFDLNDFNEINIPVEKDGVIFFNPEYGDRLGEEPALEKTYREMGDFMKQKCKGYSGFIFTGNLNLAKKIGLKPKKRIEFYNGKIECRLLEYELYDGSRN
ncbi:MAG: class I SAM-dependent RNA methyltransferase [Bacteroidetes bacterium]|nr:class I SAM-dependent RNA methyltransferase [Bacteroidota bacterium]